MAGDEYAPYNNLQSALPPKFWVTWICACISLITSLVAYVTPFWIISWPASNNPFKRLGLWEACFDNFVFPQDNDATLYDGCYFLYAPSINKLWIWINPYWYIAPQVMTTLATLACIVCTAMLGIYFWGLCRQSNNRVCVLGFAIGFFAFQAICWLTSVLLIGIKSNDRQWFIRPDQNILFVSFWFACFNVLITVLTALFAYLAFREQWNIQHQEEEDEMQQHAAPYGVDPMSGKPYDVPPSETTPFMVASPSVAPGDVPLAAGVLQTGAAPPGYSQYAINPSFGPVYAPPPGPGPSYKTMEPTTYSAGSNVYTTGAQAGGYMASGAMPPAGMLSPAPASVGYLPPAAPSGVLFPPGAPSGVLMPAQSGFLLPPGTSGYFAPGGAPSGYLQPPGAMYATGGYAAGGYN